MLSVLRVAVESGADEPVQQYYSLYYALQQMFTALCAPHLILCVHEASQADAGTGAPSLAPATLPTKEGLQAKVQKVQQEQREAEAAIAASTAANAATTNNAAIPAANTNAAGEAAPRLPPKDKCGNPDCDVTGDGLLKCSACKSVYYCSTQCQRQDWKSHKSVCRAANTARARMDAAAAVKEQPPSAPVAGPWISSPMKAPLPPPLPTAAAAADESNVRRIVSVFTTMPRVDPLAPPAGSE